MPSTTEILLALGAQDRLVAISRFCDLPSSLPDLPRVGSGLNPDLEVMLSLRPDLVLGTAAQRGLPFLDTLEQIGTPSFLVDDTGLDPLFSDILRLGEVLGTPQTARLLVDHLQRSLRQLADLTRQQPHPTVLLLVHSQPLCGAGPRTFAQPLLEAAGGENVLDFGAWVQLDTEQLLHLAPEVILITHEVDYPTLVDRLRPLQTLPAVRRGRIHQVTAPGLSRPGPGILQAAYEMAHFLHPHLQVEPSE
ncbi:MAG: ABC transporter substrate-binding protein [Bradymonadales bacterium]|nr:ABC transporter substrate-binding protein [Bradymonadales bacterium]